jgi:hypothetical protein
LNRQYPAGLREEGESEAIGFTKGGLSTKIQVATDALGNFMSFRLTIINPLMKSL